MTTTRSLLPSRSQRHRLSSLQLRVAETMAVVLLVAVLLLECSTLVSAKSYHVSAISGVDSVDCGSLAAPCLSIGFAVSLTSAGDSVLLFPGMYSKLADRNIVIKRANITIASLTSSGGGSGGSSTNHDQRSSQRQLLDSGSWRARQRIDTQRRRSTSSRPSSEQAAPAADVVVISLVNTRDAFFLQVEADNFVLRGVTVMSANNHVAVSISGSNSLIEQVTFSDNHYLNDRECVRAIGLEISKVPTTVRNCTFRNHAIDCATPSRSRMMQLGCALFILVDPEDASVVATNNSSSSSSSAQRTITVHDTIFDSNTIQLASSESSFATGAGLAIVPALRSPSSYMHTFVSIVGCTFRNNSINTTEAVADGAALHLGSLSNTIADAISIPAEISHSVFDHNWCQMRQYGNTLASGTASTLSLRATSRISHCVFTAHAVPVWQGTQFSSFPPLIRLLAGSNLADSEVRTIDMWPQWVVWVEVHASITRCRFTDNRISFRPLVRVSGDHALLTVTDSYFFNNTVTGTAKGVLDLSGSATFTNCSFVKHTLPASVTSMGHLVHLNHLASFTNCTWQENDLARAIFLVHGAEPMSIDRSTFIGNVVHDDTSCFNVSRVSINPSIIVTNSSFIDNTGSFGSVVLINVGTIHFQECQFTNNLGLLSGGYQGVANVASSPTAVCIRNAEDGRLHLYRAARASIWFDNQTIFSHNYPTATYGSLVPLTDSPISASERPIQYRIDTIDYCGEQLSTGGNVRWMSISALSLDSGHLSLLDPDAIHDLRNGSVLVDFTLTRASEYSIDAVVSMNQIEHSPNEIRVIPGDTNAAQSFAWGPGLLGGRVSDQPTRQYFFIQAADAYGNYQIHGNDPFSAYMVAANDSSFAPRTLDVAYTQHGSYNVTYWTAPDQRGAYFITVYLGTTLITNSTAVFEDTFVTSLFFVSPSGTSHADCSNVLNPCSLAAAISLANEIPGGTTIRMLTGTPYEWDNDSPALRISSDMLEFVPVNPRALNGTGPYLEQIEFVCTTPLAIPVFSVLHGKAIFRNMTFRGCDNILYAAEFTDVSMHGVVARDAQVHHACVVHAEGLFLLSWSVFSHLEQDIEEDPDDELNPRSDSFGLVCGHGTKVWLEDSVFEHNVLGVQNDLAFGGAVSCDASLFDAVRVSFINNTMSKRIPGFATAGAIMLATTHVQMFAEWHIRSCIFLDNRVLDLASADGGARTPPRCLGGAVYAFGQNARLRIMDSSFHRNLVSLSGSGVREAEASGGAIYAVVLLFTVQRSNFTYNSALGDDASLARAHGGALSLSVRDTCEIRNCVFFHNSAQASSGDTTDGLVAGGGAIYLERLFTISSSPVTVEQCHFEANFVIGGNSTIEDGGDARGGALCIEAGVRELLLPVNVRSSVFRGNRALAGWGDFTGGWAWGGGMYVIAAEPTVQILDDCVFDANSAIAGGSLDSSQVGDGGYANGGALTVVTDISSVGNAATSIENSLFVGNMANGGRGSSIDKSSTHFIQSKSGIGGGASGGAVYSYPRLEVFNVTMTANRVVSGSVGKKINARLPFAVLAGVSGSATGGAIWAVRLRISDSTLSWNHALGSHRHQNTSSPPPPSSSPSNTMRMVLADDNSSDDDAPAAGGALFTESRLQSSDCVFVHNLARGSQATGGAVAANGLVQLTNCSMHNNAAKANMIASGGALAINPAYQVAVLENCTIERNSAESDSAGVGGGVFVIGEVWFELMDVRVQHNLASGSGGGLFVVELSSTSRFAGEVVFLNNTAEAGGGGGAFIGNAQEVSQLLYESIEFQDNHADFGGNLSATLGGLRDLNGGNYLVFPGQSFVISLVLTDTLGQTVVRPELALALQVINSPTVAFTTASLKVLPQPNGIYHFTTSSVNGLPEQSISLSSSTETALYTFDIEIDVTLVECPPTKTLIVPSDSNAACIACAPGHYNFDGGDCLPCPVLVESLYAMAAAAALEPSGNASRSADDSPLLSKSDTPTGGFCMLLEDSSDGAPARVMIPRGLWPHPNTTQPETLLECPNAQACLPYQCRVTPVLEGTWNVHCEAVNTNGTSTPEYCEPGYDSRLCSRCDCDQQTPRSECWYDAGNFECRLCSTKRTILVFVLLSVMLVSIIIFWLLPDMSITLFIIEMAVLLIMVMFGIAEWTELALLALTLFLYLVSDRSIPSGLVKSFIFFVQTIAWITPEHTFPELIGAARTGTRVAGLECLSPWLFSSPFGKLLLFLLLPGIVSLVVGLSVGLGYVAARTHALKRVTRLFWRICYPDYENLDTAESAATSATPVAITTATTEHRSINTPNRKELKTFPGGNSVDEFAFGYSSNAIEEIFDGEASSPAATTTATYHDADFEYDDNEHHHHHHSSSASTSTTTTAEDRPLEDNEDHDERSHNKTDTKAVVASDNGNDDDDDDNDKDEDALAKMPMYQVAKAKFAHAVLFVLFVFYFWNSTLIFAQFQPCENGYMSLYPYIPCEFNNVEYVLILLAAVSFALLYVLGFPVLLSALLWSYRDSVRNDDLMTRTWLGFLYEDYEPRLFWFEIVYLVRPVLIAIIDTLVPSESPVQGVLMFSVLLVTLIIYDIFRPFTSPVENYMNLVSNAVLLLAYSAGNLIAADYEPGVVSIQLVQWCLFILAMAVIVAFIVAMFAKQLKRLYRSIVTRVLYRLAQGGCYDPAKHQNKPDHDGHVEERLLDG